MTIFCTVVIIIAFILSARKQRRAAEMMALEDEDEEDEDFEDENFTDDESSIESDFEQKD